MIHELDDGAGLPVRRCDRCGAVLVALSRCPSHRADTLQGRLDLMAEAHEPLTHRILEVLRSLGTAKVARLCDLALCTSGECSHALARLSYRGLARRVDEGLWAPNIAGRKGRAA